jgi:hypothetical protein
VPIAAINEHGNLRACENNVWAQNSLVRRNSQGMIDPESQSHGMESRPQPQLGPRIAAPDRGHVARTSR